MPYRVRSWLNSVDVTVIIQGPPLLTDRASTAWVSAGFFPSCSTGGSPGGVSVSTTALVALTLTFTDPGRSLLTRYSVAPVPHVPLYSVYYPRLLNRHALH